MRLSFLLFTFEISKCNEKTKSKRSRERVENLVDGQQVGILEFVLGVTQHQILNRSFTR